MKVQISELYSSMGNMDVEYMRNFDTRECRIRQRRDDIAVRGAEPHIWYSRNDNIPKTPYKTEY